MKFKNRTSFRLPPVWSQWLMFVSIFSSTFDHNKIILVSIDNCCQIYFARADLFLQDRCNSIIMNQYMCFPRLRSIRTHPDLRDR